MEDELVVFCVFQYLLVWWGGVDLEWLMWEVWIFCEQGFGICLIFDQVMCYYLWLLNICLELEYIEVIKCVVEFGLGIGCIFCLVLCDVFCCGSLVLVEMFGLDLCWQFYFIWYKQKYQIVIMCEFFDLCCSEIVGISCSDEIVLLLIF